MKIFSRMFIILALVSLTISCATTAWERHNYGVGILGSVDVSDGVSNDDVISAVLDTIETQVSDLSKSNRLIIKEPVNEDGHLIICFSFYGEIYSASYASNQRIINHTRKLKLNLDNGDYELDINLDAIRAAAVFGGASASEDVRIIQENNAREYCDMIQNIIYRKRDDIFNHPAYNSDWNN